MSPTAQGAFYYFFNHRTNNLVKRFILDCTKPKVLYYCEVSLIKKGDKFSPRLRLAIKDLSGRFAKVRAEKNEDTVDLKASVNLADCYDSFWKLISYLKSFRQIEAIPEGSFSLVSQPESEIVTALRKLDPDKVKSIFKQLGAGLSLSESEVHELLQRKVRLKEFKDSLGRSHDEPHWQDFFDSNKWIFGYGLNYVILRVVSHPYVGGTQVDGTGAEISDFLGITGGDVKFTVLVEIKTPGTRLLDGKKPIRSGAWSLSRDLTDALAQTQANTETWNVEGARTRANQNAFTRAGIYTVKPKGIIVIGQLSEVCDDPGKLSTFERFRRSIGEIEIITFDELYDRARYIVEHQET